MPVAVFLSFGCRPKKIKHIEKRNQTTVQRNNPSSFLSIGRSNRTKPNLTKSNQSFLSMSQPTQDTPALQQSADNTTSSTTGGANSAEQAALAKKLAREERKKAKEAKRGNKEDATKAKEERRLKLVRYYAHMCSISLHHSQS